MTAIAQALNLALLDFVWEGLIVGLLLWIALFILRNRPARIRYAVCCAALSGMAVLPLVTACLALSAGGTPLAAAGWARAVPLPMRPAMAAAGGVSFDWTRWLNRWALPVWSIGVLLFSLRLAWAARRISSVRRQAQPAEAALLAVVEGLRDRMKLARSVRVLMTAAADCPSVVGWLRPAVLLPAATLAGLTPQQLEAVLAHELAHILRYDYLVNMLQSVVETLLFYHPAVWWVSSRIRQERELCCDDLAVDACGDALCYARALTRLERLRLDTPGMPGLALGSTGGPMLYRIRRIMGEAREGQVPAKLPGILALSLGLVCFALNIQWARGQQQDPPPPPAMEAESGAIDDLGVKVDLGGARVLHREGIEYPGPALEKGIQGSVVVEATLDAAGVVSDARVVSGPAELRKAALQSVLQWHFTQDSAGSTRQVAITFQPPPEGLVERRSIDRRRQESTRGGVGGGISGGIGGGIGVGVGGGISGGVEGLEAEARAERLADREQFSQDRDLRSLQRAQRELEAQARAMERQRRELTRAAEAEHFQADVARDLQSGLSIDSADEQSAALAKRLEELRQQAVSAQAALAQADSGLAEAGRSQKEALEKRLADLQRGMQDFRWPSLAGRRLKAISVVGLTAALREELLQKLPVRVGEALGEESLEQVQAVVKRFDEHLGVSIFTRDGQVEIRITAPGAGGDWEPHP